MKRAALILFLSVLIGGGVSTWSIGPCLAGDSHSFAVSCTVPEIPGVNTPMVVEESLPREVSGEAALPEKTTGALVQATSTPILLLSQEELRPTTGLATGNQPAPLLIQTIYSK